MSPNLRVCFLTLTAAITALCLLYHLMDWYQVPLNVITVSGGQAPRCGDACTTTRRTPKLNGAVTAARTSSHCGAPKRNIVFLKTHKTASSTVLNIIYRWGDRHNLTFALPAKGGVFKPPLSADDVVPSESGTYNVLCNHAVFDPAVFRKIMHPDAAYITILRDPIAQFKSYYSYFNCGTKKAYGVPVEEFMRDPNGYMNDNNHDQRASRNPLCVRGIRNPQLHDLGLRSVTSDGQSLPPVDLQLAVDDWMDVVKETFHFALIAEHFQESLVALKDFMCWEVDDVVAFDFNRRQESTPGQADPPVVDAALNSRIAEWNYGDVRLYQHFNRSLWSRLDLIGRERVADEKAAIQKKRLKLVRRCLDNVEWLSDTEFRNKVAASDVLGNVIKQNTLRKEMENNKLCRRMTTSGPKYLKLLRDRMLHETN